MPNSRRPMEWETQRISQTRTYASSVHGQVGSPPDIPPPPPWFHRPQPEEATVSTVEPTELPLSPSRIREGRTDGWLLMASALILAAVVASRPPAPPAAATLAQSDHLRSLSIETDRTSGSIHSSLPAPSPSSSAVNASQQSQPAMPVDAQLKTARPERASTVGFPQNQPGQSAALLTASYVTESADTATVQSDSVCDQGNRSATDVPVVAASLQGGRSLEVLPPDGMTTGSQPGPGSCSTGLCIASMLASTGEQAQQGKTFGTRIQWIEDIEAANEIAARRQRPVFEMHVSGNFAKEAFT